mmetsp:Transcript_6900/g.13935  ORF Transcript_6900/g.13935 Transcript_6900/m.13935 type:complete len:154 (+) Transcript_6900:892-1353(+)
MTAFEPEARGNRVEGLDFHKFYFALGEADPSPSTPVSAKSHICSPKVTLMAGGKSAVVTYIRLTQRPGKALLAPPPPRRSGSGKRQPPQQGSWWTGAPRGGASEEEEEEEFAPARPMVAGLGAPSVAAFEETRVWERQPAGNWVCMHFHRSSA